MRTIDMTGKICGRLTILKRVVSDGYGAKWQCQCICGNITEVRGSSLRDGQTTSCGCFQSELTMKRCRTHGKSQSREYRMWSCAKHRAALLKMPFNIEYTDIVIPKFCPVLGLRLESTKRRSSGPQPQSPTLDKIIPELGYVKGNVWVISARANSLKNDATLEELQMLVAAIAAVMPKSGGTYVEPESKFSTKTCSECGSQSGPTGFAGLSVRHWSCPCGAEHDRDVNAARNTLFAGAGLALERSCANA